jgi:hypothetical protein
MQGLEAVADRLFQDAIAGNRTAQIFIMKCPGGWRDQPDPNPVNVNVLGGSPSERHQLEWRDMPIKERKEYRALMARVEARRKGETVEVEATPVEEGEPTGEELLLDD